VVVGRCVEPWLVPTVVEGGVAPWQYWGMVSPLASAVAASREKAVALDLALVAFVVLLGCR
jgi:hypothetical protein